VIVTFDDEQTTLKIIVRKLEEGTFPLDGKPVYLE
jgi:exonuclease VII small subunit